MELPKLPQRCAANYELLTPLGSGGFGMVWRARHRHLGRMVALKVLHDVEVADATSMIARLKREARLTASLRHPNIVTVLDHDVEGGTAWIAYEDLGGATLLDRLRREKRLDAAEVMKVARQIAMALDEAHRHGILHRDVKPDNVLESEPGVYKLVDFGLARADEDDGFCTGERIVLGTPAYIAPELLHGAAASAAGDQFALGIVMYLCLTGVIPHHDPHDVGNTVSARASDPITPPSILQPAVPARVDALVMRMLDRDPAARYASMREARIAMDMVLRRLEAGGGTLEAAGERSDADGTRHDASVRRSARVPSRPAPVSRRASSAVTSPTWAPLRSAVASFTAGAVLATMIGVASLFASFAQAAEPRLLPAPVTTINLTDPAVSAAAH